MESAPLNLAHFHERRADKHLKRNRYQEAVRAMETALAYLEDAYKMISIPKAIEVLDAEKWNCTRKLEQINIRQLQYEGSRIPCGLQPNDKQSNSAIRQYDSPQTSTMSIHQAVEKFNETYTSSTLESLCEKKPRIETSEYNTSGGEESADWMEELECKDFPCLAPLELPAFDLGFDLTSAFEEQNK